jgi:hypothetical protein
VPQIENDHVEAAGLGPGVSLDAELGGLDRNTLFLQNRRKV